MKRKREPNDKIFLEMDDYKKEVLKLAEKLNLDNSKVDFYHSFKRMHYYTELYMSIYEYIESLEKEENIFQVAFIEDDIVQQQKIEELFTDAREIESSIGTSCDVAFIFEGYVKTEELIEYAEPHIKFLKFCILKSPFDIGEQLKSKIGNTIEYYEKLKSEYSKKNTLL